MFQAPNGCLNLREFTQNNSQRQLSSFSNAGLVWKDNFFKFHIRTFCSMSHEDCHVSLSSCRRPIVNHMPSRPFRQRCRLDSWARVNSSWVSERNTWDTLWRWRLWQEKTINALFYLKRCQRLVQRSTFHFKRPYKWTLNINKIKWGDLCRKHADIKVRNYINRVVYVVWYMISNKGKYILLKTLSMTEKTCQAVNCLQKYCSYMYIQVVL